MGYNERKYVPYIPKSEYDNVARDFLDQYYPEALTEPMPVPIEEIAKKGLGMDVQYICLSEELDIYGMTIFTDGTVEIYDPVEGLYDTKAFKAKTMLIDPEAVKKTDTGCRNNTIAHECVHWYKHRYYYKMQAISLPKYARYCRCRINQLPDSTDEEDIMETQAIGIAPRILMPKDTFIEAAKHVGVSYGRDNMEQISVLADFFDVSKQSVRIRLKECSLI
jgi:hypothetical protein